MKPDSVHIEYSIIPTISAGSDKRIKFSALLGMMQDAASAHASKLGVGYQQLLPIHRTFMLSRLELEALNDLPTWGQLIRIETWPRKLERLLAYRDFRIFVEDAPHPFLVASTAWLLFDTELRRPSRPHDTLLAIPLHSDLALGEQAPGKVETAKNTQIVCTRKAYQSDLDPNGHVNNTRYFDWILDALSQQLGQLPKLRKLSINFQREVPLNTEVAISLAVQNTGEFAMHGASDLHTHFTAELTV